MKTTKSYSTAAAIGCVLVSLLLQTGVHAQSADSSSLIRSSGPGLQFQLIGGVGVYYLSGTGTSSFFRAGVDASVHHTYSSGTENSNSGYSGGSTTTATGPSDQTSSSYLFTGSGVWGMTIADFPRASLYLGAGPMGSYSFVKTANTSTETYGSGAPSNFTGSGSSTTIYGLGPVVLLGIRVRAYGPVCITAELTMSALYQWTSTSSYWSATTTYGQLQPPTTSVNSDGSDLTGWAVDLKDFQIGVLLEL